MRDRLDNVEQSERVFERLEVLVVAERLRDWPLDAGGRMMPSDEAYAFVEDYFSGEYDDQEKRNLALAKTIIDLIR